MNGVDYSKQLSKEREYFQDSVQKNKEATDKRIAENEKRNEHVETKQKDNFIEDKLELEKDYQSNLDAMKERTTSTINDKNRRSNERTAKERADFTKESQAKSKDFDQKLNDIKHSYQQAFKSEKGLHEDVNETQQKRYNRNVADIGAKTDKQMQKFQERLVSTGSDLTDQFKRERHQLTTAQDDHINDVYKSEFDKRTDLQERIRDEIAKTKEVNTSDMEGLREYQKDRESGMRNNFTERFSSMTNEFGEKSKTLMDTQRRENVKANQEQKNNIETIRRDSAKKERMAELERRRNATGSGELSKVREKQLGLSDKLNAENRINQLKSQMVDTNLKFGENTKNENDGFKESLLTERREGTARQERSNNALLADKLVSIESEKEKSHNQLTLREEQNKIEKGNGERQLMLERTNSKDRTEKLKESFNVSMKSLEEKHKASIDDVSKVANMDKSDFLKKVNENRDKELFEMKRSFGKMMNSTVEDYEQRLATYQRENEGLKMTLEQRVQGLMDSSDKKLETQRKIDEEKRVAAEKDHQIAGDQKETQFRLTMTQMNTNFQKKLDGMQTESDMKIKLLTNDYENKLKLLATDSTKNMNQKESLQQVELERVKSSFEVEKARLISQYENQIAGMKATHTDQVEQLKEFKRLS